MGDSLPISEFGKMPETASVVTKNMLVKRCSVVPLPKASSQPSFRRLASLSHSRTVNDAVGHVALFMLKVAALEMVRRFSRAKCPFAWRSIQALQVLCYPPFKWIQRVAPFRSLAKGIQVYTGKFFGLFKSYLNHIDDFKTLWICYNCLC